MCRTQSQNRHVSKLTMYGLVNRCVSMRTQAFLVANGSGTFKSAVVVLHSIDFAQKNWHRLCLVTCHQRADAWITNSQHWQNCQPPRQWDTESTTIENKAFFPSWESLWRSTEGAALRTCLAQTQEEEQRGSRRVGTSREGGQKWPKFIMG